MGSLLARAAAVYREEGPLSLADGAARYAINQSIAWARAGYWRARGTRPVTVEGTTARFAVDSLHESRELEFLVANERPTVAAVLSALSPGDVFYDVGAHVGFYSCFAARAGADVVAFEPYPPNVERLRRNLRLNDADATVRPVALSDAAGEVAFDRPDEARSGWSRASIATDGDAEPVTVPAETGDGLVDAGDVPPPTVVKIDVEGAEGRVVEGMADALARPACRLVVCEVHRPDDHRGSVRDYGDSEAAVRAALADLGFDVETLADREAEVTIRGASG